MPANTPAVCSVCSLPIHPDYLYIKSGDYGGRHASNGRGVGVCGAVLMYAHVCNAEIITSLSLPHHYKLTL